ncbi:MAG: AEC family transporter [Synergistaceae bacterium]|jgi:predicted permease|nr:AEC family transporter [Synergistaceae bacterium]
MKGILIVAPLVLVIMLGMALRASGFLKIQARDTLTRLLYWVILPPLLFRTTYLAGQGEIPDKNLFIAAYGVMFAVPLAAFFISSILTHKNDRIRLALATMAAARANNVYLGLPACILALGSEGMEAASLYLAVTLPGYNLISIMWGEVVLSGGINFRTLRLRLLSVIKNPMVVSCLLGLSAAWLEVPVPETLMTSMKIISDMATGVALMALGVSLEISDILPAIRHAWHDALIKLVLHPAMTWLFFSIWPAPEMLFRSAIIISSMPTAINTFILAGGMRLDERYACEIIAVSTCLAPITIPLWIALLGIN